MNEVIVQHNDRNEILSREVFMARVKAMSYMGPNVYTEMYKGVKLSVNFHNHLGNMSGYITAPRNVILDLLKIRVYNGWSYCSSEKGYVTPTPSVMELRGQTDVNDIITIGFGCAGEYDVCLVNMDDHSPSANVKTFKSTSFIMAELKRVVDCISY